MVAWRTMEAPILLTLLMLGFVAYMGLSPWLGHGRLPILSVLASPTPLLVAGPVANPVERVVVPKHSIWAQ